MVNKLAYLPDSHASFVDRYIEIRADWLVSSISHTFPTCFQSFPSNTILIPQIYTWMQSYIVDSMPKEV